MNHTHDYLAGRLRQKGIRHSDLAYQLGMNPTSVSHRMTGRTSWTRDEMYLVMDIIQEPLENLHLVFPRLDMGKLRLARSAR